MAFDEKWRRLLRRSLRVLAGLALLFLAAWLAMAAYVHAHRNEILANLTQQISREMRGELQVESMEPSLLHGFPYVSLTLKSVSLRDSLWGTHHHSLFECRSLFVSVNPFALIGGRLELRKITASDGSIFLYTNARGYSNTYLLHSRDSSKQGRAAIVSRFGLRNMQLWFVNDAKQKVFHFLVRKLDAEAGAPGDATEYKVSSHTHVYGMAFSTLRGAYLKNRELDFKLRLSYRHADKWLHIPEQNLRISGQKIRFGGDFHFDRNPPSFAIRLSSDKIACKTALAWTSDNIQRALSPYDFEEPVSLRISVSGLMKYHSTPLIHILYPIRDNTLITPLGSIEKLSYDGEYLNRARPGLGQNDSNSLLGFYHASGEWRGLPFRSDTLLVVNLLHPWVTARIQSSFPLAALNDAIGVRAIAFDEGQAETNLRYEGAIAPADTAPHRIDGHVRISHGKLRYLPRALALSEVNATLLFAGSDLFLRQVTLRSGHSSVAMEGDAINFLRFYFADPDKASVAWRVRSPFIDLRDFMAFAAPRQSKASSAGRRKNAATRLGSQLGRVLDAASFSLDARASRLAYKSFVADGAAARMTMTQSGIRIGEARLQHGSGVLQLSGSIRQGAGGSDFQLQSTVRNEDVAKLFAAFNNFGQDAIVAKNLSGRIRSDLKLRGQLTAAGAVRKNSLYGNIRFGLEDGALLHFGPFEKVGRFVFKKRNLSDVRVRSLQGELDVRGEKILIRPLAIQTSVVNMNVQGVYGLNGGTDIFIEVPLRNPEKEEASSIFGKLLRRGKGVVLHLRAQDPDGSGVRIGWDPLKHGRDATEEALQRR
jgi:hypothetical protein